MRSICNLLRHRRVRLHENNSTAITNSTKNGQPYVSISNEEILKEAKVEPIAMVIRSRRLEWFVHVKRRDETEHIRAVVEMKMEGKRPRGRPKLRWKYTVRRDLNACNIREEWATDRERWKGFCKTRYSSQGDGGER